MTTGCENPAPLKAATRQRRPWYGGIVHPASLQNLTPWPQGTSGNPGGAAKVPEWLHGHRDELLKLQLQAATKGTLPTESADGETGEQKVSDKHRLMAIDSLLNRLMGRPKVDEDRDEDERSAKVQSLLVALTTSTRTPT